MNESNNFERPIDLIAQADENDPLAPAGISPENNVLVSGNLFLKESVKTEEDFSHTSDSTVQYNVNSHHILIIEETDINDGKLEFEGGFGDSLEPSGIKKTPFRLETTPQTRREGIAVTDSSKIEQEEERGLEAMPIKIKSEPGYNEKDIKCEQMIPESSGIVMATTDHDYTINYIKTDDDLARCVCASNVSGADHASDNIFPQNSQLYPISKVVDKRADEILGALQRTSDFPIHHNTYQPECSIPIASRPTTQTPEKSSHKLLPKSPETSSPVSISMLLAHPFVRGFWSADQLRSILLQPVPLSKFVYNVPKRNVKFPMECDFSQFPWLCNSPELKNFFCWPCLLFSTCQVWSVPVPNMYNQDLQAVFINHQTTFAHRNAEIDYKTAKRESNLHTCHELWKRFVRTICYERIRNDKFQPEGNIEFYAKLQPIIKKIFPKTISSTEIGLLCRKTLSLATTYLRNNVLDEVSKAQYATFSVLDLSAVVGDMTWLVVIARYVDENGRVNEKVMKFLRTNPANKFRSAGDAVKLFHSIFRNNIFKETNNVVGFSYSASVVAPSEVPSFHKGIQRWCPRALFFHSPCESLYVSLFQAITHHSPCRKYFQDTQELCDFMNTHRSIITSIENSPGYVAHSALPKKFDGNFSAKLGTHFFTLSVVFERIINSSKSALSVRIEAKRFVRFLQSPRNRIFILVVSEIFSVVSGFAEAVKRPYEETILMKERKKAIKILKLMKSNPMEPTIIEQLTDDPNLKQFAQTCTSFSVIEVHTGMIHDIIDTVVDFLTHRFDNLQLFNCTLSALLESTLKQLNYPAHYQDFMQRAMLDPNEMRQIEYLIYKPPPFVENKKVSELLDHLVQHKKTMEYSGLHKYLLFLRTISFTRTEQRQLLKSIHNFIKNTSSEGQTEDYMNGYFWQMHNVSEKLSTDSELYFEILSQSKLRIVTENDDVKIVPMQVYVQTVAVLRDSHFP